MTEQPSPRRRLGVIAAGAGVAALVVGSAVALKSGGNGRLSALLDRPAPQMILQRNDGSVDTIALAPAGMISVINFWAPWCIPCRAEHKELNQLSLSQPRDRVQVVGVTFDASTVEVSRFLDEVGRGMPIVTDPNGRAAIEFGVVGVPETFVIDGNGVVRDHIVGPTTADDLRIIIARIATSS
jgi:cytochrome c biogenesis protein CcmG, thiol:disulfide interchange protein DsbE